MCSNIRSRLIISYIAVILVALAIALIALIALSRPVQARTNEFRLVAELNRIITPLTQNIPSDAFSNNRTLVSLITNRNQNLSDLTGRLLLIDAKGQILFDAYNVWTGRKIQLPKSRSFRNNMLRGQINFPGDGAFVFVAQPFGLAESNTSKKFFIALVTPYPEITTAFVSELWAGFLVAGIIAFLLSVLLGLAIARSVAKPLRTIAKATNAIAEGDYTHTVPESGPYEIKQLAQTFNGMTQQVQNSQTAMRDFVSNVSHELKTPLTSIQGFSQALLDGATQDETTRKRAATIIYDESARMRRLIEDLLDLAKIDAGQMTIGKNTIELTPLIKGILNTLSPQIQAKHLTITKNLEQWLIIMGNGDRLTQVFTNLIDNAIKHTPIEGTIQINAWQETKNNPSTKKTTAYACISITDSGPGIPPDEITRIFERFYQIDKSRTSKPGQGVGLGLTIAHDIVKAHSGYIEAKNIEGKGMQFKVCLPSSQASINTIVSKQRPN